MDAGESMVFRVGTLLNHPVRGKGTVIKYDPDDDMFPYLFSSDISGRENIWLSEPEVAAYYLHQKDDSKEEIVTDPITGGQKGKKLEELGFVDPWALEELARVAGMGAQKYEKFNYLRGYDWSLSYNALQRHLMKFWGGEDDDPESQQLHLAHAAWHCLALISFMQRGLGNDDRFKG